MGMLDSSPEHKEIALNEIEERNNKWQDGKNKFDFKDAHSTLLCFTSTDFSSRIILNIKGFTLFNSLSYIVHWSRLCL